MVAVVGASGAMALAAAPVMAAPTSALSRVASAKIPAGFPKAVPLPKHYKVLVGTINPYSHEYEVVLSVPGTVKGVVSQYKAELKAAGFSEVSGSAAGSSGDVSGTGKGWLVSSEMQSGPSSVYKLPSGDVDMSIIVTKA